LNVQSPLAKFSGYKPCKDDRIKKKKTSGQGRPQVTTTKGGGEKELRKLPQQVVWEEACWGGSIKEIERLRSREGRLQVPAERSKEIRE